jgi:hypothetical protein
MSNPFAALADSSSSDSETEEIEKKEKEALIHFFENDSGEDGDDGEESENDGAEAWNVDEDEYLPFEDSTFPLICQYFSLCQPRFQPCDKECLY